MKIGKLVIAWRHEEQLLRAVEMGARHEIRAKLADVNHIWTRRMIRDVVKAAETHIAEVTEDLVKSCRPELVDALMTELQNPGTPLRTLLAKVIRSTARDFVEQQAEDTRTAIEAANPCKDGYTEHDFGEAGLTSCERCGYTPPAAAAAAPRALTEQIASADAVAAAVKSIGRGVLSGPGFADPSGQVQP